jgi:hypothetical protein
MHLEKGNQDVMKRYVKNFIKFNEEELNELELMPNTRIPGRKIMCNYVFLEFLISLP